MDIEILTTKKKLTKSVVAQLEEATLGDLEHALHVGKIGYYVKGLHGYKNARTGLIRGIVTWKVFPLNAWEKHGDKSIRLSPYQPSESFSSTEVRDKFFEVYHAVGKLCLKNHLIL